MEPIILPDSARSSTNGQKLITV